MESLELLLAECALNREDGIKVSDDWLPACELLKGTETADPKNPPTLMSTGVTVELGAVSA